ncbi:MAG: hypothetical protein E6R03_13310 [Hyphomicrobiaceae bacterium]|nr:MAG: hypothetical protein E6R03_13310 [Hyphomicrobiaceae bacterium]
MNEMAEYSAEWWAKELDGADKEYDDKWRRGAQKVVDRYLDDRRDEQEQIFGAGARKYNIFWSNIQILKAAMYATPPRPEVTRQHDDAKDDVARAAALVLKRMLTFDLQEDEDGDHMAFQKAVEDRLIPGLGQVWLRYEPKIEPFEVPEVRDDFGQVVQPAQKGEKVVDEQVVIDFVHWNDFYWSPARTWEEVWWVGRRVWLTRGKFEKRFGAEKYKELQTELRDVEKQGYPKGFEKGRVEVFELWCLETKKAYWIHRATKAMLDQKPDPYQLRDFFPCPCPLLATHSTQSLIPRPDYVMCQDQYDELDVLNGRIYSLTKALRVVGVYDQGNAGALGSMLTAGELRMIPVDNWAAFAEKGGIKGVVDWFPVEQIQKVLMGLIEQRQLVIQQIYELTSISDIMRGVSQARETAKAQSLKAQYSSVRLQLNQQAVGKFVCEVLRIKVQIISNLFQPHVIMARSQIEHTESAALAEPAVQLIKSGQVMQFRIKVGEQSLSMADYNAERELRVEFLTAIGQFLSQAAQMAQSTPGALPFLLRMVAWVAASFRGADDIETVLDEAIKLSSQAPQQPDQKQQKPPPPPPEQAEQARAQADIAVAAAETKNKAALATQAFRHNMASEIVKNMLNPPNANL